MNAIDVTKYPEVQIGTDGEPRRPDDPPNEIVRTAAGLLYERRVVYWRHIPELEFAPRTSSLLVHALQSEWWWTWAYEKGHVHFRETIAQDRFVALARSLGDTAGNDERIAWRLVNLYCREMLPSLCDLAGLAGEAARLRGLPVLTLRSAASARRTFRRVERAAERLAPEAPGPKLPLRKASEVGQRLDLAERRSGVLSLWVAMIGCDAKVGEKREWDRVRRVYHTIEPMVDGAAHAVFRAAGKVATLEQAAALERELTGLVDGMLRDLPRAPASRRAA